MSRIQGVLCNLSNRRKSILHLSIWSFQWIWPGSDAIFIVCACCKRRGPSSVNPRNYLWNP